MNAHASICMHVNVLMMVQLDRLVELLTWWAGYNKFWGGVHVHWVGLLLDIPGLDQASWVPVWIWIEYLSRFPVNPVLVSPWMLSYGRGILVSFPHCSLALLHSASQGAAWLSHMHLCTVLTGNPVHYSIPLVQRYGSLGLTSSWQSVWFSLSVFWISSFSRILPLDSHWEALNVWQSHCWWSPCIVFIYIIISFFLGFCLGEGWGWLLYELFRVAIAFQHLHYMSLLLRPIDSIRRDVPGTWYVRVALMLPIFCERGW